MSEQRTSAFFDAYARDFDAIYGNRNTFVNRIINRMLRKSMRLRYEMTIADFDQLTTSQPELKVRLLQNFARALSMRVRKLTDEVRVLS